MRVAGIRDVVLIGAGNVASSLGLALVRQEIRILQVYDRSPGRGRKLASKLGASFTADHLAIVPAADLYILAIPDSAIELLASELHLTDQLVVHTSGSADLKILSEISGNIGVFYPLQTFSKNRRVNFIRVPICVEANGENGKKLLGDLAAKLSGIVSFINSDQRKILHLAAVFASNYTNFMVAIAEELLRANDIPFELLKPLINQTVRNAHHPPVSGHQTGPAVRGDKQVLASHRTLLKDYPDYLEIYNMISDNIIKYKALHGKL